MITVLWIYKPTAGALAACASVFILSVIAILSLEKERKAKLEDFAVIRKNLRSILPKNSEGLARTDYLITKQDFVIRNRKKIIKNFSSLPLRNTENIDLFLTQYLKDTNSEIKNSIRNLY